MKTRLVSLDAFRGLTIAGMILVNNPGSWAYVYAPLRHAEWHGWTPTDLIFPYFLFIVGVAIPLSLDRRLADGAARADLVRHVAKRAAILILLGLGMRAIPDFDFATMRYYGVLQRIGVVYFAAASCYLFLARRGRALVTVGVLAGYWALLAWVPVPGFGAGDLSAEGNLAAWLDRALMDGHLWQGTWDPEGLLSTLPAVATSLLGIVAGEWLSGERPSTKLSKRLVAAGILLTIVGLVWGGVFPINKNLWTSSYVVFTAGTALVLLGSLHEVADVRGYRGVGVEWMVVYGMNAIAVFVASGMLSKALTRLHVGGPDGPTAYGWLYERLFRSWAGDFGGSLAFALVYVGCWLGAMWVLHSRRIYLKI